MAQSQTQKRKEIKGEKEMKGRLKPIKYRSYQIEIIKKTPNLFMYNINNAGWVEIYGNSKEAILKEIKKEVRWMLNVTPIASGYRGR